MTKFAVGDTVMAKWPGSTQYFRAKIKSASKTHYDVKFEDGTKHKVPSKSVLSLLSFRKSKSPGRSPRGSAQRSSRSSSRGRGRRKSEGDSSTSRSRSSSRKTVQQTPTEAHNLAVTGPSEVVMESKHNSTSTPIKSESTVTRAVETSNDGVRSRSLRSTTITKISETYGLSSDEKPIQSNQSKDHAHTREKEDTAPSSSKQFGGVFGTFVLIISLPAFVFLINAVCTKTFCHLRIPVFSRHLNAYFDPLAFGIFVGWVLFQAVLAALPIGRVCEGLLQKDGTRLKYRCNGLISFFLTMTLLAGALYYDLPIEKVVLLKFQQILVASIVISWILSIILYLKARRSSLLSRSQLGNTGNIIYDFFMGLESNPRIGTFDIKFFLDLRPGLIGWMALNVIFLWKDYKDDGEMSLGLALTVACQMLYVIDSFWLEDTFLSTMDINLEGLGFMLVFGNLSFVPFFFSLESRYLLNYQKSLPWYCLAGICLLNIIGYLIYRKSNSQKNEFRRDPYSPDVEHLEVINTGALKKILAGGWWGFVRHPNYFGDILMSLAWCLPCGFDHLVPYSYTIYLMTLLVHRSIRDDSFCRRKYGASWDQYCDKVRYRIFRGIF